MCLKDVEALSTIAAKLETIFMSITSTVRKKYKAVSISVVVNY